jgi:hypothetical protein
MTPGLRKLALTAHVTFSVGWLGAVLAYLAVAVACLVSRDAEMVHAGFPAMELMGWFVIVPLSLAALLSGLVQSLGTEWGLFRYYWVLVKFAATVGAVTILLLHMPAVSRGHGARAEVVHAGGGLLVLLMTTTLSVYKPWGRTQYGRRKQRERQKGAATDLATTTSTARTNRDPHTADLPSHPGPTDGTGVAPDRGSPTSSPWGMYVLLGTIGVVLLFVILHLTGGGHAGHGH